MKNQNELPAMHKLVLSVLPVGHESAIPFKEVMSRIGHNKDTRQIRDVLSELPTYYNQPVGSVSNGRNKGFYIVKSFDDYEKADYTLKTREHHLRKRRIGLRKSWLENKAN